MKRYFGFIMVAVAAIFFTGCLGSGGSSAPAPTDVQVIAKDGRAILTWTMAPGVEYWIFHANGTGVTPENCSTMPLCFTDVNVTSPAGVMKGLTNGLLFSFSINGRKNGGPGGPGSAAVQTSPRLSGTGVGDAIWKLGASTTVNLRGVAYGTSVAKFVAAGDSGALYSGSVFTNPDATTGITWSPLTNPSTATFNAVSYDASGALYLVAGSGGAILQSTDAVTWTLQTSATTKTGNDLYAVANNGASSIVATGAAGTIIYSLDRGANWLAAAPPISGSPALNGIAYGFITASGAPRFVAVGAAGTVLWSQDGVTWTSASLPSPIASSEVKGVTYGLVANVGTFVAVTADGYVASSTDGGITWTTTGAKVSSSALNGVTVSLNPVVPLSTTVTTVTNSFVTVDNTGNVFQSIDGGASWTNVYSGSTPLYAITHGGLFDYSAVGASGVNLYAD